MKDVLLAVNKNFRYKISPNWIFHAQGLKLLIDQTLTTVKVTHGILFAQDDLFENVYRIAVSDILVA